MFWDFVLCAFCIHVLDVRCRSLLLCFGTFCYVPPSMMDCVLSGSLLVVFSLFCYAMCVFFEQINSLSLASMFVVRSLSRPNYKPSLH